MIDKKKLLRMSRAWKAGVSLAQFARRFGYKSNCFMTDLRHRYPDLFPLRDTKDGLDAAARKRGYVALTPKQWATKGWTTTRPANAKAMRRDELEEVNRSASASRLASRSGRASASAGSPRY